MKKLANDSHLFEKPMTAAERHDRDVINQKARFKFLLIVPTTQIHALADVEDAPEVGHDLIKEVLDISVKYGDWFVITHFIISLVCFSEC